MSKRIDDRDLEEVSGAGELGDVSEKEPTSVFHPPGTLKDVPASGGGNTGEGDVDNTGSGGDGTPSQG